MSEQYAEDFDEIDLFEEKALRFFEHIERPHRLVAYARNGTDFKIATHHLAVAFAMLRCVTKDRKRIKDIGDDTDPPERLPIAIWDKKNAVLWQASDREIQDAWDAYANGEARRINESGVLDSYDTVSSYHQWSPSLSFIKWLALREEK
jgi:hypothetical protein